MPISDDQIRALLERPSESLQVEIKTWLDTADPLGIAKLVKAVFAIRNRNGGFLVLGFDDRSLEPAAYNLAEPMGDAYHVDRIQALVSRYAFDPFPIEVAVGERAGQQHPIVVIPDGVQIPVVAKSALDGPGGKKLIAEGGLYFRTLSANGTPSTAQIHPRDYRALLDICFDNREADIGRFLRRQLGGAELAKLLQHITPAPPSTAQQVPAPVPILDQPPVRLRDETFKTLAAGADRFRLAVEARGQTAEFARVEKLLTMEVALTLDPPRIDAQPTRDFQRTVASANPQLTGWPIWLDSSNFREAADRPYVKDEGWEALISDLNGGWSQHFEFMRLEPRGAFYLRRVMQDDLSDQVPPRSVLDPFLMTYRIAEAIVVGLRIAQALDWNSEGAAGFAFRWSSLAPRRLSGWANPARFLSVGGESHTEVVNSYVEVPISTPESSIAPFVASVAGPLFIAFSGFEMGRDVYEDFCRRLIERKID
ncbi:hypothetical protein [Caulobacter sp. 1776]|uniref:hypothetical protein n=1 Tax=Caulobacter sp. 1776 TaxID=3156420 RepID=UPI00339758C9